MPDVWERLRISHEKLREAWREYDAAWGELQCVECKRTDRSGERGWRTYLTVDDEPATYCPECAEAEFNG